MKSEKVFLDIFCILFLLLLCGICVSSNPAAAADKTVCETGCDHDNIQDAIDAASPAGTVTVNDSRTYIECIDMKDGVNVTRLAGQTPTISCNDGATVEFYPQTASMTCNLDGFEITHPTGVGAGIFMDGTSDTVTATVSNCNIYNIAESAGIRMNGVVNATITGNTIYDCGTAGISVAEGYVVSDTSSITIKGNTIGAASPNHNQSAGIYLKGEDNVTAIIGGAGVDGNTIQYNAESGIRVETITDLTIDNNTVNNNTKGGILLIDVGSASADAIVKNNDIFDNDKAGINIGGASYLTVGGGVTRLQFKNDIYGNYAGVAFNMKEVQVPLPPNPSSQEVEIIGNHIHNNDKAGIAVIDYVTGPIIIDDNDIEQNTKAGIAIFNKCTVDITDNHILTHTAAAGIFTGDWSGLVPPGAPAKFDRTNGPAILSIKRNKVHGNRAGMRLDHASGTLPDSGQINNNLVYGNSRAGIRFSGNSAGSAPFTVGGSWGIAAIENNTVDNNGSAVGDPRGGGIVYDDINATHTNFFDPPVGATQNPITIKNNIVTNNMKAGIKFCADNSSDDRAYNLFYRNVAGICDTGGSVDCGRMCRRRTLGRCDAPDVNCCTQDTWADRVLAFPGTWAAGEICGEDPLFDTDYTLLTGSPAIGTGSDTNNMGAYGGSDPINW